MKIHGQQYRSIWLADDGRSVQIIDQTRLPHDFSIMTLRDAQSAARAIREMWVRGAPLIGATAAYGMALGVYNDPSDQAIAGYQELLLMARPTAVNLRWALERVVGRIMPLPKEQRAAAAYAEAAVICDEDVAINSAIGNHGLELIKGIRRNKSGKEPVRILTHCNAGWLATVDWGTALAPIYKAHDAGIHVQVWVDETRPRNQGATLTAWELGAHGVPFDLVVDNAGGHLMQHGAVDLCLVGTDRTTKRGDVCNKIGTYLKALAAQDNHVPFYVALPSPTIDWQIDDGLQEIPIEERGPEEVTHIQGKASDGQLLKVQISPDNTTARNPAFDVTPATLVTGLITERGICEASEDGLVALFPEHTHPAV